MPCFVLIPVCFVLLLNSNLSFIKIINAGEQFLVNNIDGMAILLDLRTLYVSAGLFLPLGMGI